MKKLLMIAIASCFLFACNNKPAEPATSETKDTMSTAKESKPAPQSEFADPRYTEMGKKALDQLAAGNMDAWLDGYAENAVYRWSSGDSLVGKKAISDYWKERRSKVIDSMRITNDIWLPIKVNRPQKGPDAAGIWLLGWYQVNVTYKNGKKLMFWVHTDLHYDNNDKIDIAIQYIDRAPINKALGH